MKKIIASLAIAIIAAVSFSGCKSTSASGLSQTEIEDRNVARLEKSAEAALSAVVAFEPQAVRYLAALDTVLRVAVEQQALEPEEIRDLGRNIGVKELTTPKGLAAANSVLSIYDLILTEVNLTHRDSYQVRLLEAVRRSISKTLDALKQADGVAAPS